MQSPGSPSGACCRFVDASPHSLVVSYSPPARPRYHEASGLFERSFSEKLGRRAQGRNTCEAGGGAPVLHAACVFFDKITWSVLVVEGLSRVYGAFDEKRAPVKRSAALSCAGVGRQR